MELAALLLTIIWRTSADDASSATLCGRCSKIARVDLATGGDDRAGRRVGSAGPRRYVALPHYPCALRDPGNDDQHARNTADAAYPADDARNVDRAGVGVGAGPECCGAA